MLDRLEKEYTACTERRRAQELELVKKHSLERLSHPSEELYLINFECAMSSTDAATDELLGLFRAVSPSIGVLPEEHQQELFRLCIPHFVLADYLSRTKRIWGSINKYMMSSVLMCTDLERLEVWAARQEDKRLRTELLGLIRAYIEDQKEVVIPAFERANLSERETLALLPLLLSESVLPSSIAEQCQPLLDSIRREILADLHRYYTEEMGISEYSTRLGNLLTICNSSRESYEMFTKFFRMQVTIFDLYSTETMLQVLIL